MAEVSAFESQHQPPLSAPSTTSAILADTSPGPFEGPEKLLEIWFAPSPHQLPKVDRTLGSGLEYRKPKEGAEKQDWRGLRKVKREVWEDMLKVVKCQVLSVIEGEDIDAYLLSESSLFIAPHLIILKTCGTTINLLGLTRIIEIAREYCGFDDVYRCFYSRKSFFFPERQVGPHRGWKEEVDFLDGVFNHQGNAYTVGPMNGDHWLLYLINPPSSNDEPEKKAIAEQPNTHHIRHGDNEVEINVQRPSSEHQDQTLEILMTHLSPEARAPFFHPPELDVSPSSSSGPRSGHHLGSILTQHLGIDKLFDKEESIIDSFGFEPCGYSANGIVGSGSGYPALTPDGEERPGGGYWTIHVTPEEGWSFASFECNVPLPLKNQVVMAGAEKATRPDLRTLIRRVIDIFQPGRLSITLFLSTESENALLSQTNGVSGNMDVSETSSMADSAVLEPANETEATKRAWTSFSKNLLGDGYMRKDRIGYEFEDYDLVFGCFEKRGFKSTGKPVLST